MATAEDQGMVPIPSGYAAVPQSIQGVVLVHADGYANPIGLLVKGRIEGQVDPSKIEQVQQPDVLRQEGDYLVGYDAAGNEIFRQLIRSTRKNALTHLPLLLGE